MSINYNEIDKKCIPFVEYFNKIGLETEYSCEGHFVNEDFYIIFSNKVKDEQIERFILDRKERLQYGFFYKWCRIVKGNLQNNWVYIVNSKYKHMLYYELYEFTKEK